MELLLFLSALLTALTGAITGVRPVPVATQEQVCAGGVQRIASDVVRNWTRPAQGWPTLATLSEAGEQPWRALLAVAGYGQRRRE